MKEFQYYMIGLAGIVAFIAFFVIVISPKCG